MKSSSSVIPQHFVANETGTPKATTPAPGNTQQRGVLRALFFCPFFHRLARTLALVLHRQSTPLPRISYDTSDVISTSALAVHSESVLVGYIFASTTTTTTVFIAAASAAITSFFAAVKERKFPNRHAPEEVMHTHTHMEPRTYKCTNTHAHIYIVSYGGGSSGRCCCC